jgi:hypothetical protein
MKKFKIVVFLDCGEGCTGLNPPAPHKVNVYLENILRFSNEQVMKLENQLKGMGARENKSLILPN